MLDHPQHMPRSTMYVCIHITFYNTTYTYTPPLNLPTQQPNINNNPPQPQPIMTTTQYQQHQQHLHQHQQQHQHTIELSDAGAAAQRSTTQHNAAQRSTTQHNAAQQHHTKDNIYYIYQFLSLSSHHIFCDIITGVLQNYTQREVPALKNLPPATTTSNLINNIIQANNSFSTFSTDGSTPVPFSANHPLVFSPQEIRKLEDLKKAEEIRKIEEIRATMASASPSGHKVRLLLTPPDPILHLSYLLPLLTSTFYSN